MTKQDLQRVDICLRWREMRSRIGDQVFYAFGVLLCELVPFEKDEIVLVHSFNELTESYTIVRPVNVEMGTCYWGLPIPEECLGVLAEDEFLESVEHAKAIL